MHTLSYCSCSPCGPSCPCLVEGIGCYYDSGVGCSCSASCAVPNNYAYDARRVERERKRAIREEGRRKRRREE